MKKWLLVISLLFLIVCHIEAAEQHKYVRKSGNDGNGGTSWADAWLTIQHAADNANPASGTPITIHVAAGTYAEQVDIDTYAGTDDDNRIIYDGDVENDSGDGATRPIVDGEDTRNRCLGIQVKSYITIQDFEAKRDAGGADIQWEVGATYITIQRCIVHDGNIGISSYNASAINAYIKIINNIIYNTLVGINVHNARYLEIYNNVIYGCTLTGIYLQATSSYATVKNNISHNNSPSQINIQANSQTGLVSDYNDWFKDAGTYTGVWGATNCSALSDWQTASSQDANSQEGDPLYVDEAGDDFHITDNASPCYQTGVDLSATFTDDYDKDTRVHWDIGADYIVTTGAPPEAPKVQSQILILE